MIEITPSPTADTRTCDWKNVCRATLLRSSLTHIDDVAKGLGLFAGLLTEAAARHDFDKLSDIDGFHRDFKTGFAETTWWDNHRKVNRHHVNVGDGVPNDVNLIDIVEHIVDCVMAGVARSGSVYDLELSSDVLQKAFHNTVELLAHNVQVAGNGDNPSTPD